MDKKKSVDDLDSDEFDSLISSLELLAYSEDNLQYITKNLNELKELIGLDDDDPDLPIDELIDNIELMIDDINKDD